MSREEIHRHWEGLRERVESRLREYVALPADCPDELCESMAYSLLAGGKRLRPLLVLLASEACGGSVEAALPAACAIEMVHTYSLIHDDLPAMDDDELRRGRPTNHVQFNEATAILAGDALLTLAFEVLARDVKPAEAAVACCRDLASAAGAVGMVAGQSADLAAERGEVGESRGGRFSPGGAGGLSALEGIHRRKTGCLFCAALTMGARVAGADSETVARLENYGSRVGLAFQIADDLLDVSGDREKLGKNVRRDAEHGKLTYPALLGVDESRRRAERLVSEAREAVAALGERARGLDELARFVLERDH